jgi:hypothetical protein
MYPYMRAPKITNSHEDTETPPNRPRYRTYGSGAPDRAFDFTDQKNCGGPSNSYSSHCRPFGDVFRRTNILFARSFPRPSKGFAAQLRKQCRHRHHHPTNRSEPSRDSAGLIARGICVAPRDLKMKANDKPFARGLSAPRGLRHGGREALRIPLS